MCRCTGYRPILEGLRRLTKVSNFLSGNGSGSGLPTGSIGLFASALSTMKLPMGVRKRNGIWLVKMPLKVIWRLFSGVTTDPADPAMRGGERGAWGPKNYGINFFH